MLGWQKIDAKLQARLIKVNKRLERRRAEGKKICNGCKQPVKLTDFHVSKANLDGRVTLCKVCRNERNRINPQKHRPRPVKAYNDKPIKCTQCRWIGIEADLNNSNCPDCQSRVRPIFFATIQDSLQALKDIGQEMMPMYCGTIQEGI